MVRCYSNGDDSRLHADGANGRAGNKPYPAPAANGLKAGAESQDKPTPREIAAEIAEFRDAITDLFPERADRDASADILLDLKENGRIDAPEMRAKIERGIKALEASLVA